MHCSASWLVGLVVTKGSTYCSASSTEKVSLALCVPRHPPPVPIQAVLPSHVKASEKAEGVARALVAQQQLLQGLQGRGQTGPASHQGRLLRASQNTTTLRDALDRDLPEVLQGLTLIKNEGGFPARRFVKNLRVRQFFSPLPLTLATPLHLMLGYTFTWMHLHLDAPLHLDALIHPYNWMHLYLDALIHPYMDALILGCTNTWMHLYTLTLGCTYA